MLPAGRNVIGGHRIAEHRQRARALDVGQRRRRHGDAVEVGRVLDVGGLAVPGIDLARRRLDGAPIRVAREHVGVAFLEHRRVDRCRDRGGHILRARPDVLEVHRLAVLALAQRLGGDVDVQAARQRVGDDQGRRGEEIHFDFRMHAALEISIARQHGAGDDIGRS